MSETELNKLARLQHGVFSRSQAVDLGIRDSWLRRRVVKQLLRQVHHGVYGVAAVPPTWKQEVMAFCLAVGKGVYASHRSAAALWAIAGFERAPLEFVTARDVRSRGRRVRVRRLRCLEAADVTTVDSVPVTTPTRTVLDLASVVDEETLEIALDDALRRGLTSVAHLQKRLERIEAHTRVQSIALGRLLATRSDGQAPTESPLETKALQALRRSGLPEPNRQYKIFLDGRFIARVDLAYPAERVAIETDGYAYHSGRARWEKDLARRNSLQDAGWRVVHVTAQQLRSKEPAWIEMVRRLLQRQLDLGCN